MMKTNNQLKKMSRWGVSKYIPMAFICVVAGIFFSSCHSWLHDHHHSNPLYWSYGVVHKTDSLVSISTDKGNKLYPNTSFKNMIKDGERYMLEYFIVNRVEPEAAMEVFEISVYDYFKVLTKDIIPFEEAISDSLGSDPVKVNHAWVANQYINFYFTYWGRNFNVKHMINLTQLPDVNEDGHIVMEFRHNAYGDPYTNQYRGMVSFPVESLVLPEGVDPSTVKLIIKYLSTNGEKSFEMDMNFSTEPDIEGGIENATLE